MPTLTRQRVYSFLGAVLIRCFLRHRLLDQIGQVLAPLDRRVVNEMQLRRDACAYAVRQLVAQEAGQLAIEQLFRPLGILPMQVK